MGELWILSPVLIAAGAGIILLIRSFAEHLAPVPKNGEHRSGRWVYGLAVGALLAAAVLALGAAWSGDKSVTLFYLMEDVPIFFQVDALGRWFVTLVTAVWVPVGIYSLVYMRHEGNEKRFFGFYLLLYGVLVCLDFAGNLVTMYLFYELMTLASFPLVLHNGSREAIMAALKYLFYSLCGAYLGLYGIYFLYRFCKTPAFAPGGVLDGETVAPSPASAVLSGVIVKSGVLAIIRVVYYIVGPDLLRGTWVQYAWMALTLATVFMGSLLAYREPVLKKRLAYSTVSNLSYILFGLAVLSPAGFTGALLHAAFHGIIKCGLFLTAGIFLLDGKTRVEELSGTGRRMPTVLWCYTLLSLALIGIPPASGFVSKWYLAQGALGAGLGAWGYVGTAVLLVSALLTAGYLLPVVMKGFFPGTREEGRERREPKAAMLIPLLVLAALALGMGLFPGLFTGYADAVARSVL